MTTYLIIVPALLVYQLLPYANKTQATAAIVTYVTSVLAIQAISTIRVYISWRATDYNTESPTMMMGNTMNKDDTPTSILTLLVHNKKAQHVHATMGHNTATKVPPPPPPPGSFHLSDVGNLLILSAIALETIQMASYPLQKDPFSPYVSETDIHIPIGLLPYQIDETPFPLIFLLLLLQ